MPRRTVRLPTDGRPLLDLLSFGRPGPSGRFTPEQIAQSRRTVSRAPEVMVKVTGGGMKVGAVAAHLAYISRKAKSLVSACQVMRRGDLRSLPRQLKFFSILTIINSVRNNPEITDEHGIDPDQ